MFTLFSSAFDCLDVPFITEPQASTYRECGSSALIQWQYDGSKTIDTIHWYFHDSNGGINEEFAKYENNTFSVNEGSTFPPATESRITFSPNAGIIISNFAPTDEATISIDVAFTDLDHSVGETGLFVSGNFVKAS